MAVNHWQAQACPRATCLFFGQKGRGNICPRGWHGRRRDIRLLWCRACGQRFSERRGPALFQSKLSTPSAVGIVERLMEGCGIRPTSRLCRVDTGTVMRLLRRAGVRAKQLHDERVRGLTIAAIQLDEKRCVLQGRRLRLPVPRSRPEQWKARCRRPSGSPRLWLWRQVSWDHVCIASREKLVVSAFFGSRTLTARLVEDVAARINDGAPPLLVETDEWMPLITEVRERWYSPRVISLDGKPDFVHAAVTKIRENHRVVKCIRRIKVGDRMRGLWDLPG